MPKVRLILLSLSLFLLIRLYVLIPSYLGPEGLRDNRPPGRLIRVETAEGFDAVLKEERAAVFFSARWSVRSKESELVVKRWVGTSRPRFPVYLTDPTEQAFVMRWLDEHEQGDLFGRGSGDVMWLRQGTIVTQVIRPGRDGQSALEEATHEAFGSFASSAR